jgi:hypothetical protein
VAWSKGANPAGQQRGLPKARGGGDEHEASVEASIEQGQEMRASNDLMGGDGGKKLGRKQSMRK